jgi:hypothetical protein
MSRQPKPVRSFRPELEPLESRELLAAALPSLPGYSSASAAALLGGGMQSGGLSSGSFSLSSLAPFVSSPQAISATLSSIPSPQAAQLNAAFTSLTQSQQSLAAQTLSSNLSTPATPIAYALSAATVPVFNGLATANGLRKELILDQQKLFTDFNSGASPTTLAADYSKAGSDYSQLKSVNSSLQPQIQTDETIIAGAHYVGDLNSTDTLMLEFSLNAVMNASKALNRDVTIGNEVANAPGPNGLPTIASGEGTSL